MSEFPERLTEKVRRNLLQITSEYGIMSPRTDGWVTCPRCGCNRHFLRVLPGTAATKLPVFGAASWTPAFLFLPRGDSREPDRRRP